MVGNPIFNDYVQCLHLMASQIDGSFIKELLDQKKPFKQLNELSIKYDFRDLSLLCQHLEMICSDPRLVTQSNLRKFIAVAQDKGIKLTTNNDTNLNGLPSSLNEIVEAAEEIDLYEISIKGWYQIHLKTDVY